MPVKPNAVHRPNIDKLPVELLSHLFTLWSLVDNDAPWMAASVSQEWRRIVLRCPRAWSNISVILKAPNETTEEDRAWCIEEDEELEDEHSPRGKRRPLDLWFARSGSVPIALTLAVAQTHPHIEFRIAECVRVLEAHAPRLRRLSVQLESVPLAEGLFCVLPRLALHMLEVHIQHTPRRGPLRGAHTAGEDPHLPTLWSAVRAAQHVRLSGCFPPRRAPQDALGTESLELHSTPLSVRELAPLLAQHQCLTALDLSEVWGAPFPFENYTPEPVQLPALTRLTIGRVYMDLLTNVFVWLRAPALTHLTIGTGGVTELVWTMRRSDETSFETTARYGAALAEFVSHCPALESLCLMRATIHDRHLVDVLGKVPSLCELRIEDSLVGTPLLRALTLPMSATAATSKKHKPVLCPNLQRLSFKKCDLVVGEHLIALVQSRNRAGSPTTPLTDIHTLRCPNVSVAHLHDLLHAL